MPGEARDGLCDMRDQAITERLAEAYRKREARERRDKLKSELRSHMHDADTADVADESPVTVDNDER